MDLEGKAAREGQDSTAEESTHTTQNPPGSVPEVNRALYLRKHFKGHQQLVDQLLETGYIGMSSPEIRKLWESWPVERKGGLQFPCKTDDSEGGGCAATSWQRKAESELLHIVDTQLHSLEIQLRVG